MAGKEFEIVGFVRFTEEYYSGTPIDHPTNKFRQSFKLQFVKRTGEIKSKKKRNMVTLEDGLQLLEQIISIKNGHKVYMAIAKLYNKREEDLIIIPNSRLQIETGLSLNTIKTTLKSLSEIGAIYSIKAIGNSIGYSIHPKIHFNHYKSMERANAVNSSIEIGDISSLGEMTIFKIKD